MHWFFCFSFQLPSIILSCGSRPSFVFSRQDFPPLRWNRFSTYVKKKSFFLPKLLMLWRPLFWFLHQILFFISIVVYLPALALEQVTQYQFFRLEEVGYGIVIWSIYFDIYVYRYELMYVKKVAGVNLDLFSLSLFVFVYIFVFVLWYYAKKGDRGQLGSCLCICICFVYIYLYYNIMSNRWQGSTWTLLVSPSSSSASSTPQQVKMILHSVVGNFVIFCIIINWY